MDPTEDRTFRAQPSRASRVPSRAISTSGASRTVQLRLFVKEEYEPPRVVEVAAPMGCDFAPLHDLVCETLLGGENERWTLVRETRNPRLQPDGSGHIDIAQEWSSKEAALFTHPADDCCPVTTVGLDELRGGADVYTAMLGQMARTPLTSSADLAAWWASHPRPGPPMLAAACSRLLAKMQVVPTQHVPPVAAAKLVAEGLAGLRELAADRWHAARLPTQLLEEGLVRALRWEPHAPANKPVALAGVLEAAAAAAWSLAMYGSCRTTMVAAGVVPELVTALARGLSWREAALSRGAAAVAAAEAARAAEAEAVTAKAAAEAAAAAKAEQDAVKEGVGGKELDALIAASDAAALAVMQVELPTDQPTPVRELYGPPAGEVSLDTANRVVYNCLGALGVLAVDAKARSACLKVSPNLAFLVGVATAGFISVSDEQHDANVAAWRRRQERKAAAEVAAAERAAQRADEQEERARREEEARRRKEEEEAAEAAAAAQMAAEDPELAALLAASAAKAKAAKPAAESVQPVEQEPLPPMPDEQDVPPPPPPRDAYPLREVVPPEDNYRVHQLMAAEALYTMLGRERAVRRAFAASGGIPSLQPLLRSENDGVVCAAISCLAAYARDVGHDHATGVEMLATAAVPPPEPAPGAATPPQQGPGGVRGKRSLAPEKAPDPVEVAAKAAAAVVRAKAGNGREVAKSLLTALPPVLEALLIRYANGARKVGGVLQPSGCVPVIPEDVPGLDTAEHLDGIEEEDGDGAGTGASASRRVTPNASRRTTLSRRSTHVSRVRSQAQTPRHIGGVGSVSRPASVLTTVSTVTVHTLGAAAEAAAAEAAAEEAAEAAEHQQQQQDEEVAAARSGRRRRPALSQGAGDELRSFASGGQALGEGAGAQGEAQQGGESTAAPVGEPLYGRFAPQSLSYMIELAATALWAAVAAEQRASEVAVETEKAAAAAEKRVYEDAAAAAAAAAAEAAREREARRSSSGGSAMLAFEMPIPAPLPAMRAAAPVGGPQGGAGGAVSEGGKAADPEADDAKVGDTSGEPITPMLVERVGQMAVAAARLVATELLEQKQQEDMGRPGSARGYGGGGGGGGARDVEDGEEGEEGGWGLAADRRQQQNAGSRDSGHSCLLGCLHSLLGALCIVQGNDRLVKREYGALLAKYGLMRRLQVQKELAEEEMQARLEEIEAARKQPGRFFFEEEEEAKRQEARSLIRSVEARMRRALQSVEVAEDALEVAAAEALHAVGAALALLPYGDGGAAAAAVGAGGEAMQLSGFGPLPAGVEAQLCHCHVLAAGVVQGMAAMLQPGAVEAAAAAQQQLQRSWEAETSVSAAAAAADAATAAGAAAAGRDVDGPAPAETMAATATAAALYQGPYRELILQSGVLPALLAATKARYSQVQEQQEQRQQAASGAGLASKSLRLQDATGPPASTAPSHTARSHTARSVASRYTAGSHATRRRFGAAADVISDDDGAASPSESGGVGGRGGRSTSPGSTVRGAAHSIGGYSQHRQSMHDSEAGWGGGQDRTLGRSSTSRRLVSVTGGPPMVLDTTTHVLLQATSAALMNLCATESPLQPQQLAAAVSYMQHVAAHPASGPFLAAACYSLARHVANRRGMVEGVTPKPPTPPAPKPKAAAERAAGIGGDLGLGYEDGLNGDRGGDRLTPRSAQHGGEREEEAAAAVEVEKPAPAPITLGADVWVEVVTSLLRAVLAKLRKAPQPRVSLADALSALSGAPTGATLSAAPSSLAGGSSTAAAASVSNNTAASAPGATATPTSPLHAAVRSGRFLVMATWLLVRQWLVDQVNPVNTVGSAEGIFARAQTSWWGVRLSADTMLTLSHEVLDALGLTVEAMRATAAASAAEAVAAAAAAAAAAAGDGAAAFHATHRVSFSSNLHGGSGGSETFGANGGGNGGSVAGAGARVPVGGVGALRRLAARAVWSLAAAHPAVATALVDRGAGVMMLSAMRETGPGADSVLQALAVGFMLHLAGCVPSLLPQLGGLDALCSCLVALTERALAAGGAWPGRSPAPDGGASPHPHAPSAGHGSFPGGPDGRGVDVRLLEAAVRGLAFLAGQGAPGRVAVTGARAVRRLVAVVRVDNGALEAVRAAREEEGVPPWVRSEELLCPLRAVNSMPIAVLPAQEASLASLAALQPPAPTPQQPTAPHSPPSSRPGSLATAPAAVPSPRADSVSSARPRSGRLTGSSAPSPRPASARMAGAQTSNSDGAGAIGAPPQAYGGVTEEVLVRSRQSGSADVGLTALWGVLNLSGHEQAQTKICRHGLYTLMAAVHGSADPARSAAARAILTNIHYHPGNATVLYKAELKLKYAALNRMLAEKKKAKEAKEAALRRMAAAATSGTVAAAALQAPADADDGASAGSPLRPVRPLSAVGGGGGGARSPGGAARPNHSARGRSATTNIAHRQFGELAAARAAAAMAATNGSAPPAAATVTPIEAVGAGAAAAGGGGSPRAIDSPRRRGPTAETMLAVLGSQTAPGGKSGSGGDAAAAAAAAAIPGVGGEGEELDVDAIETRLKFLQWMVDPNVKTGVDVDSLAAAAAPGGGTMSYDTASALLAAAAAGGGAAMGLGGDILGATLTSDPEELHWLGTVSSDPHLGHGQHATSSHEARTEAKWEAGTFMRGNLTRSLAAGAHSLWKEGGDSAAATGSSPAAVNTRRLGSARPHSSGANRQLPQNQHRSSSVGRSRPGSALPGSGANGGAGGVHANGMTATRGSTMAANGAGGRWSSSALRASAPTAALAWPPAARASAASVQGGAAGGSVASVTAGTAAGSAAGGTRFVNLHGAGGRNAPGAPPSTAPSQRGAAGGGGSKRRAGGSSAAASAFSMSGNPWAPHILRFVQDPPKHGGPRKRNNLIARVLTAVPPEYVTNELLGLTDRLLALTSDRRQQEDRATAEADAAAAAVAEAEDAVLALRRLGVSGSGSFQRYDGDSAEEQDVNTAAAAAIPALRRVVAGLAAEGSLGSLAGGPLSVRDGRGKAAYGGAGSGSARHANAAAGVEGAEGTTARGEGSAGDLGTGRGRASKCGSMAGSEQRQPQGGVGGEASEQEDWGAGGDMWRIQRAVRLRVSLLPPALLGPPALAQAPAVSELDGICPDPQADTTAASTTSGPVTFSIRPTSVVAHPPPSPPAAARSSAAAPAPSTYLPGGSGASTAASYLAASVAPSGLPYDSAASLISTASYDTISTLDPSLARSLHSPAEAYRKPHTGPASPPGTRIAALGRAQRGGSGTSPGPIRSGPTSARGSPHSVAAASSAERPGSAPGGAGGGAGAGAGAGSVAAGSAFGTGNSVAGSRVRPLSRASAWEGQLTHPLSGTVPRPVTVLAGSVADLLAAKAAREAAQAAETPGGSRDGTDAQGSSGVGAMGFEDPFASTGAAGAGGAGAAAAAASGGNGNGNGAAAAAGADGGGSNALGARRALSKASSMAASAVTGKSSGAAGGGAALAAASAMRTATAAALGAAADSDSESDDGADPALDILKPQPLSVLVATGDGGTDRLYRFPRFLLPSAHHMCLFEHVEGCRFCETLFGHYLLPSGALAHFYLGDTVVKGHRVDLPHAPDIPFTPLDWVADALPPCAALADWGATTPGRPATVAAAGAAATAATGPGGGGGGGVALLSGLWCPLPLTPPAAARCVLEWDEDGQQLAMKSVSLEVVLSTVQRTETRMELVAAPPKPPTKGRKKKAGAKK